MSTLSTLQTRDAIASGKISAVSHISQYLKTIESRNKEINAVLHLNPNALQDAKAVDEKIAKKQKVGKLAGLGIIVKSNICVKDLIANCGSNTLANYVAPYDADVIQKIRAEDGIIIGMANQDEFACGASGETSAFGPTNNPAALGFVAGGSSSGSAASVAANFCDIALGSDTGGSIRNPASHCGIVGIKPSYGRVSRFGLIDLSMSLDQIGPLARDVEGCALMMEVISGYSQNDPTTMEKSVDNYSDASKSADVSKLKIGLSTDFEKLCVDKRIYKIISDAVASFKPKNILLKHVDLAIQTYYPLVYVEFYSGTRKFDGRRYGKKIEDSCGDEVLRRIMGGQEISKAEHAGKYYRTALAVKNEIAHELDQAFDSVDVIVLPTTPILPHKIGSQISVEAMYAYDAFTGPANLAGCCAGVIPVGKIDNVPVGLQVYCRSGNENIMFAFLKHIESVIHQ